MLALLLAASCLLTSCVYYNGMYNANKYAAQAEASERNDRPSEARDRWVRAELHAESVAIRHPNSRWADDARLVQGKALLHLGDYSGAVVALQLAAQLAQAHEQKLEALLLLGEAQTAIRNFDAAAPALDSAVGSSVPRRHDAALLARGRLRLIRDPEAALADFRASAAPEAPLWRARAAFAAGMADSAALWLREAALDKGRYREEQWLPLLDSLAAAGRPDSADAIADHLARRRGVATGQRARLLLGACDRTAGRRQDSAAAACYRRAAAVAPDSVEAIVAVERLARLDLIAATEDSVVADARERLGRAALAGGGAARDAGPLLGQLARIERLHADSAGVAAADVRWFLRAEIATDSLGMRAWGARQFAAMADRFPDSPWTPKALLAAIGAGHPAADSLRALLLARWPESPYAAVAQGRDAPRYAQLEDSLRVLVAQLTGSPAEEGAPAAAPAAEDDVPGRGDRGPRRPVRPGRPAPGEKPDNQPDVRP